MNKHSLGGALAFCAAMVAAGAGNAFGGEEPKYLYSREDLGFRLLQETTVGGVELDLSALPDGMALFDEYGIVGSNLLHVQRMHGWPAPVNMMDAVRATRTPGGDLLVMFAAGMSAYGQPKETWEETRNVMLSYRSFDDGRTWRGPVVAWWVPYSSSFNMMFIPRGSTRIYGFGSEPIPDRRREKEDAPIVYRISDDDGYTWSRPHFIRPVNDPDYVGITAMPMCETDAGTWIAGTHTGDWSKTEIAPVQTRQYMLRSEDQGQTWELLPGAEPNGWYVEEFDRMDEARPIHLGDNRILVHARTAEGHLWEFRSEDDGRTWSEPRPTPLVHPDAPPMTFFLSDGGTLMALHHNRYTPDRPHFHQPDRSELWFALSRDGGESWSEPRFLLANAVDGERRPSVSYTEMVADKGEVHLFIPHLWKQMLHVRFSEADMDNMPTIAQLSDVAMN